MIHSDSEFLSSMYNVKASLGILCERRSWALSLISEVKIGIVAPLRDGSVDRCPILRSVRRPHAAWLELTKNTGWISTCRVRGLECDMEVREAGVKSLASVPGPTGKTGLRTAINPSTEYFFLNKEAEPFSGRLQTTAVGLGRSRQQPLGLKGNANLEVP